VLGFELKAMCFLVGALTLEAHPAPLCKILFPYLTCLQNQNFISRFECKMAMFWLGSYVDRTMRTDKNNY
jgi:hypothetical protein